MSSKTNGWLVATLFLSVLLNLLIAGGLFAMTSHGRGPLTGLASYEAPHGEYMVGWLSRRLDPDDAAIFTGAYREETDAIRKAKSDLRKAMEGVGLAFALEQPNEAALQESLDKLNTARGELHTAIDGVLKKAYPKLSYEGRQRLTEMTQNKP